MVSSPEPAIHLNGLRLATWVSRGAVFLRNGRIVVPAKAPEQLAEFWDDFASQNAKSCAADITAAASCDEGMLYASLRYRFLTVSTVLTTAGSDLSPLFNTHHSVIFDAPWLGYLEYLGGAATRGWGRAAHSGLPRATHEIMNEDFTAIGQFLMGHPKPPWLSMRLKSRYGPRYEPVSLFAEEFRDMNLSAHFESTNPTTYLGAAATVLIIAEMTHDRMLPADSARPLCAFSALYPYILRRWGYQQDAELPELPVPEQFQQLFRAWANQEADFINDPADF
jgi:hypothetical protein